MRLLFWNLNRKENSRYVEALLMQENIDVGIFAEYEKLAINKLLERTGVFQSAISYDEGKKVILIHKKEYRVETYRQQDRFSLYRIQSRDCKYNLAAVHLQDRLHNASRDRERALRLLKHDMKELEKASGSKKSIIIGDFNANPFDNELIAKDVLNAVLFKKLIKIRKNDTVDGKSYDRYYNPMLTLLSEDDELYGTHYYTGSTTTIFWHCFDQMIVSQELINSIGDIKICKKAGEYKLLSNNGLPKKSISDHLPLVAEVLE